MIAHCNVHASTAATTVPSTVLSISDQQCTHNSCTLGLPQLGWGNLMVLHRTVGTPSSRVAAVHSHSNRSMRRHLGFALGFAFGLLAGHVLRRDLHALPDPPARSTTARPPTPSGASNEKVATAAPPDHGRAHTAAAVLSQLFSFAGFASSPASLNVCWCRQTVVCVPAGPGRRCGWRRRWPGRVGGGDHR